MAEEGKDKQGSEGFGLPPGYFDRLKDRVFERVTREDELDDCPFLLGNRGIQTFSVPPSYFTELPVRLELSGYEALKAVRRKDVFTVPEGYFELSRVPVRPARIITLVISTRSRIFLAAAAVLLIAVFAASYDYLFTPVDRDCGTVACLDRREIIRAAGNENIDEEEISTAVDTEKLKKLLQSAPSSDQDIDEE